MRSIIKNKMVFVMVLMLVLMAALSACGGASGGVGGEAFALYDAANKAIQEAEGYQMDMTMVGKVAAAGQDTDMDVASHFEINDPNGNVEMLMSQKTKLMGQEMDASTYMKDGYLYSEAAGTKTKTKMDLADLAKQANNFVDFPQDAIVDQKVENADSGKKLTFTVKGDAMSSYIMKNANLGQLKDGLGMSFGDMIVTAVVGADGNMTECSIKISMEMNLSGQESTAAAAETASSMTMDMTITMSNIKIGKVDIKAPADLASYQELNLDNLMGTGSGIDQ